MKTSLIASMCSRKRKFFAVSSSWLGRRYGKKDRKSTRLNSSHTVISYAVFCLKKKQFLTAGAMGVGGLSLAGLLRAEAAAGISSSNKAGNNIHFDGGPPHQDMIDLKPDAPVEI